MSKEEAFVNELIGYIFAYPDDDYMTMECLCRKLHKHGLIDKKDGEWTCNFIEQVDTPQTERKCIDCKFLTYMYGKTWCNIKCDNPHDKVCDRFKPKDEQTDEEYINNLPWAEVGNGEQTDYEKGLQEFADLLFDKDKQEQFLKECKAMGIEPQTDCAWK